MLLTATIAIAACVHAAAAGPILDGVYSSAQAERGKALYAENCGECHRDNLRGDGEFAPGLGGAAFTYFWGGKSLGDFFETISTKMPADRPGGLVPSVYADIVAYILQFNRYPAGPRELEANVPVLRAVVTEPRP